jgi:subtilisin family serine protease
MRSYLMILLLFVSTSSFAQQRGWQLMDLKTDSVYGLSVNKAYAELLKGKKANPIVVAVLDGGTDIDHEDLKNRLWTNKKELAGDQDRDKNGYAGDIHGWNFLGNKTTQVDDESLENRRVYFRYKARFEQVKDETEVGKKERELYRQWLVSKKSVAKGDTVAPVNQKLKIVGDDQENIKDRFYGNSNLMGGAAFHGTHVAGIIGAARNNGIGMDGIADSVRLMVIRAVPNGDEHDKDIALGIRYAVDNGARIVNMSFGKIVSPYRYMVEDAIKYAEKKGVLLINAAGNDHQNVDSVVFYPTPFYMKGKERAGNMITVGASNAFAKNLVAGFSNYGKRTVDVFAPGVAIYSTLPGNKYQPLSGTSMATPVVSGLAAMLMSYYPELKAKDVKRIIEATVTKINFPVNLPGTRDKKIDFSELCRTGGIVNAYEAVKMAEGL